MPVGRFDRDASVGRDQRQHALDRLFGDDHDAQRRAGPRRQRRRQDGDFGRVRAAVGCRCGRGCVVAKSRTEYPPAISKNAVAAAAKRRARSI